MKKLPIYTLTIVCSLCFFLSGCLAILGINEIKPVSKKQAQSYLRSTGIKDTNIYQMDYNCFGELIKNKINKDTSSNIFPLQNVLFENGSLVSWIKICDGPTQMKKWETFPPQSHGQINPNYTLEQELSCIKDFNGKPIQLDSTYKYVYLIYFIRKNGLLIGIPLRRFVRQSVRGMAKHKKNDEVKFIYVNSNPTDSLQI